MAVQEVDQGHPEECDIFVSYSQDSPEHKEKVRQLAEALEAAGYLVAYDQQCPSEPDGGWANYMADQFQKAKHRIIVLSEGYGKRRGSKVELTTIRNAEGISPQAQHLSKVYFESAYDDGEYRRKHGLPELGSSFYSLVPGFGSENLKWIALLERIQSSTGKQAIGYVETEVHHGIILVGDIVGFSDARRFYPHKQELVLQQMWNFLKNHPSIKTCNCPLDSTLDGAVVVFDELYHKGRHQPTCELAIDFATDWIKFMRVGIIFDGEVVEVPFRVGMDMGRYSQFRLDGKNGTKTDNSNQVKKVVGAGPNDCDRLTRIGDAYDIIIGQRFYEELRENSKRDLKGKVFPPPDEPALEVYPKPYHKQLVRVYPGFERDPKDYFAPMVLRQTMAASENIESILQAICGDFHDWLREEVLFGDENSDTRTGAEEEAEDDGIMPPATLSTLGMLEPKSSRLRVSIFARKPDDPENTLSCTTFRLLAGYQKGSKIHRQLSQPRTEYPISGDGKGIVGKAFHSKIPIVLHDLPDWADEQGKLEYIARMDKFGFTAQVVRDFARHPRILICFRCVFGTLPPDAVVCVDSMSPLPNIPASAFRELGDFLQQTYGPIISVLLRIRA